MNKKKQNKHTHTPTHKHTTNHNKPQDDNKPKQQEQQQHIYIDDQQVKDKTTAYGPKHRARTKAHKQQHRTSLTYTPTITR